MAAAANNPPPDTPVPSHKVSGFSASGAAILLRIGEAFTYKAFRNIWTAAFTSAVGTWMQRFAQQWLIFDLTKSVPTDAAFYLGVDAFAGNVPLLLFTLLGGVVADRYDRRYLLMGSQILQMCCALTLTALVWTDTVTIPSILVLSFTAGTAQAFGGPSFQSLIPSLVPRKTLPNAIALNSIQFNLAQSVGPLIGGLVLATLGLVGCFGLNGLSFLVVVAALAYVSIPAPNQANRKPVLEELKGGLLYVGRGGALLSLTVLAVATTSLGLPIRAFLPVFADDPNTLSQMMAALGTGAVVGALIVAWLGTFNKMGLTLLSVIIAFGGLIAAFALTPVGVISYIILFFIGVALLIVFSLTASLVQLTVPDELRGRVMSIYLTAFRGGMPLGSLVSGYIVASIPWATIESIIAVNGGLLALVATYFLIRSHGIREL
ncbi:MAG TPA: MFS transporter [Acidobacteria bacterium]|nr:MFS transporter [Acidobacteriota bacterium]